MSPLTPTDDELDDAVAAWERAAPWSGNTKAGKETCLRAAAAPRLQKQTGKPHCTEHLLPTDERGACSVERHRRVQR